MITFGNRIHGRILAKASGCSYNPESNVVISREKDGKLLGGVIFQAYTGASIAIQIASFDPRWIDRDMLWMAFHYPFDQLGVQKLFTQTPSTNLKALDFKQKIGIYRRGPNRRCFSRCGSRHQVNAPRRLPLANTRKTPWDFSPRKKYHQLRT